MDTIEVKCNSGHTYAERPQSFQWQSREYIVKEVLKDWREPGKRCFKVSAKDNKIFQLCYNEAQDSWTALAISD